MDSLDRTQRDKGTYSFDPSELVWIAVSDVFPWVRWDFELLGEAIGRGVKHFAIDRSTATFADGPIPPGWIRLLLTLVPKRFLPRPYFLRILVLRKDLPEWKDAASWAGLRFEPLPDLVQPGRHGTVWLQEHPGGRLQWIE